MEVYSPEFVKNSVEGVKADPAGFLRKVEKNEKLNLRDVVRSMDKWGIYIPYEYRKYLN